MKLAEYGAAVVLNYAQSSAEARETADLIRSLGGKVTVLKADVCSVINMDSIAELVCNILVQPSMTGQIISSNNGMLI